MSTAEDKRERQREIWKELHIIIKRYRALGYDYVVKRIPPARICFGSTIERDVVPQNISTMSPLMVRLVPKVTYQRKRDPYSKPQKYKVRGAMYSKTPRSVYSPYPFGGKMYNPLDYIRTSKQCARPFGRSMKEKDYFASITPGPGTYMASIRQRKNIFRHSFGGTIRVIPAAETLCMPGQYTVCCDCNETPKGDYWLNHNGDMAYCRPCMNEELFTATFKSKTKSMKNKRLEELHAFRRVRHCAYFHDHQNNTKAFIQTVPREELLMKFRCEDYLSIFNM